jgi:hypothetical protein
MVQTFVVVCCPAGESQTYRYKYNQITWLAGKLPEKSPKSTKHTKEEKGQPSLRTLATLATRHRSRHHQNPTPANPSQPIPSSSSTSHQLLRAPPHVANAQTQAAMSFVSSESSECTCYPAERNGYEYNSFIAHVFSQCVYEPRQVIGFWVGMSSLLFWVMAQVPQFIKNKERKSASSLSPWFLLEWMLGDVLNLVGCLLTHQVLLLRWQLTDVV